MMKQNRWLIAMIMTACALAGQGCATRGQMAPAGRASTEPGVGTPAAAVAATALLNMQVTSASQDPASLSIRQAVRGRLTAENFKLNDDLPDLRVDLRVSAKPFDQTGNYWVYDGRADASVVRLFDQKTLGQQTFTARGERKLGQEEALASMQEALADKTATWISETAASGRSGLAAYDITLQRPALSRVWKDDSEYARFFISEVTKLNGLVSCVVAQQDYNLHTLVFRIVYYPEKFPEGLLNRLATMSQLDIKPGT